MNDGHSGKSQRTENKDQDNSKRHHVPAHWNWMFKPDNLWLKWKIQKFVCLAQPGIKKCMKLCCAKAGIYPVSSCLFPKQSFSSFCGVFSGFTDFGGIQLGCLVVTVLFLNWNHQLYVKKYTELPDELSHVILYNQ